MCLENCVGFHCLCACRNQHSLGIISRNAFEFFLVFFSHISYPLKVSWHHWRELQIHKCGFAVCQRCRIYIYHMSIYICMYTCILYIYFAYDMCGCYCCAANCHFASKFTPQIWRVACIRVCFIDISKKDFAKKIIFFLYCATFTSSLHLFSTLPRLCLLYAS